MSGKSYGSCGHELPYEWEHCGAALIAVRIMIVRGEGPLPIKWSVVTVVNSTWIGENCC